MGLDVGDCRWWEEGEGECGGDAIAAITLLIYQSLAVDANRRELNLMSLHSRRGAFAKQFYLDVWLRT